MMHTPLLLLVLSLPGSAAAAPQPTAAAQETPAGRQLRVFLDCHGCYSEYLRSEITFVDYVRDRTEADVHLLITDTSTGSGGREYTAAFIGAGRFQGVQRTLKAFTTTSDSDDTVRRQVATMVRLGLLTFLAQDGVPQELDLRVDLAESGSSQTVTSDRWNYWVFSVRGSASFDGEESQREWQVGGSVSADRITPDWKITFGAEFDQER